MKKRISDKLRDNIYRYIKQLVEETKYDIEFMNLLSSIWDVYKKPKLEDYRFSNLGDEIEKHFVMNNDWSEEKMFNSVLHLKDDDDKLIRFFSGLLNISTNSELLQEIQYTIQSENLTVELSGNKWHVNFDNLNMQCVEDQSRPFYVCRSNIINAFSFLENEIQVPLNNDCFILTFNYGWNDYGYKTRYKLHYIDSNGKRTVLGNVKIMHKGTGDTSSVLPQEFYSLPSDFCSLGEDVGYYKKFKELFGSKAFVYLSELCDVALYSRIHEKFASDDVFIISLHRYNSSEKALREGRYYVYGRDMCDAFSFSLLYKPKFFLDDTKPISVTFPFKYECPAYRRMIGLIGENGTGKSTLINDVINGLIQKERDSFDGLKPIFAKILVISFSPFDHFPPLQNDYTIGYDYCGLLKSSNELYSLQEQIEKFISDLKNVRKRGNVDNIWKHWLELAKEVVPIGILENLCDDKNELIENSLKELKRFCLYMSSGETIFLFSISRIMSQIRPNSLLLFDEPEQHLHPQAITKLINAILDILETYQSYAIVATHSALVIREIPSENVYVFNRNEHFLNINKIGIESFGEDISVLNNYVFKNLNESKRFEHYVANIARTNNYDFTKIVNELQNENNELSLNLKMLIMDIINRNEKE